MPDQNGEVGIGAPAAQRREVFAEGLKLPIDPGTQRVEIHPFDHREVAHDHVAQTGRAGHDAEAAIAHHRRGDAERGRRR
jgi:hypothetical protein